MAPINHILFSAPLGLLVGALTQNIFAGLLCFFSGFLIDGDHLFEYILYNGIKDLRPKKVYRTCAKMANKEEEGGVKRIFLLLHTVELAILLWISLLFTPNIYILAAALGYSGHLALDAHANTIKPTAYFISTRIKNGFLTSKLIHRRYL